MVADWEESFVLDGLTVDRARERAEYYRSLHQSGASGEAAYALWEELSPKVHSDCFYLNSSDGLAVLQSQPSLQRKRVLTIASAGDAAQLFLSLGAAKVDMVDLSLPGILYNELKLHGLSLLDFSSYQELFCISRLKEGKTWLDLEVYSILRPSLSHQARTFFDTLVDYPSGDPAVLHRYKRSFIRARRDHSEPRRYLQTIGTLLGEREYEALQLIARERPPCLRFRSVTEYLDEPLEVDLVYLSNVGYLPMETVGLAEAFLQAGVKTVWIAISPERAFFQADDSGLVHAYSLLREKISDGLPPLPEQSTSQWFNRNLFLPHERSQWLERLGDRRDILLNQVQATSLGLDPSAEFGLMLQIQTQA